MAVEYVLGHTHRELDRLDLQGLIYRDVTERAFTDAGLRPGMRVLDLGCGSGDVSRLAAKQVGPEGSVLGVDLDASTVASARRRSEDAGISNTRFEQGDATAFGHEGPFDALVARFFLMHQTDPGKVLAEAAKAIKPGGVVVMIESNMNSLLEGVHSFPHSSLFDEVVKWKSAVVGQVGADLGAGMRLGQTFQEAGLPAPTMRFEAMVEAHGDSPVYRYMAESVRSMLPMAQRHGIDGFTEARINQLAAALHAEVVEHGRVLMGWPVVAAWCRLP